MHTTMLTTVNILYIINFTSFFNSLKVLVFWVLDIIWCNKNTFMESSISLAISPKTRSWWQLRCLSSEPPVLSQHPAKFSKSCGSGDIISSICDMTNVRSCGVKGWSLWQQASTLPSLVVINLLKWRYNQFNLSCHFMRPRV